jgi:hypothetical protein
MMIERSVLVLSVAAAALACGGGSPSVEEEVVVSAERGGTVSLEQSVLRIPAQALAMDTAVSMRLDPIEGLPPLQDAHDDVLAIEPAATTLTIPATLVLDLGGPVEPGQVAAAHHLVDGAWSPVASEVVSGGLVQISITALGSFAVTRRDETPDGGDGNQILGTLRWATGDPVGGAPVELRQGGSPLTDTVTDGQGGFRFVDLAPGEYELAVSYECELTEKVAVEADAPTEVELVLCQGP